jgi:hypothetical protein
MDRCLTQHKKKASIAERKRLCQAESTWSVAMSEMSDLPAQADQSYREKRTVPRYSFIAHVEMIEPASDTHIAGRVSEISRKGCYIDVLITLPPGTLIQLKVLRDLGTFSTKGKIIYAQE